MTQDLSLAVNNRQENVNQANPHKVCNFTHLHLHTPWSLLDGFCRIDDLINLAKEYGMDSIGVSEHGNCHSHVEFYTKCKEAGIKPILGCEVYITPNRKWKKADYEKPIYDKDKFKLVKKTHVKRDGLMEIPDDQLTEEQIQQAKEEKMVWAAPEKTMKEFWNWRPNMAHLLLIAKNNEGYKNLLEMTSRAYTEGFYFKPRCDYELIKQYGKGIIATTACLGGEVPQLIRQGKYKTAQNLIRFYQECFDELYLEIQPSDMPEQILVNNVLMEWSKEMDIPLVATSDAHMLKKEEKPVHAALTTIGKNEDPNDISVYEHCYFMSSKEMIEHEMPQEALENAYDIAQRCNVEIDLGDVKFPQFHVPEGYDFDNYLSKLANTALFEMALERDIDITTYQERMNYELQIIKDKNISAYFLIVWDYIKYAKDNDILVGPGRGSAAGSLVSYLLGITNLDPIKYNLLFERFLNPERAGFPDVDSDFDYERRHEVIEYVTEKYGEENVAQIGTFTTLSTKAAFKDIARGLGIDHNIINDMNKLIPVKFGTVYTIDEALEEVEELRKYEQQYPQLFELARKVQGQPRSASIHACGLLITPDPIHESAPLMKGKDNERVTQYDGPTLEDLGFIKFDFLGLKNLSVINIARQLVRQRHGIDIDPDKLEPNDPKVYSLLQQGHTEGIFQLESDGMKKVFRGLNKVDFESLIAGVSLYRPGPLEHIPEYQDRANGYKEVEYPHPELEEVLKSTFGVVVYQEQLMQMTGKLAGYSAGPQDKFRKAVGKKDEKVMRPALEKLQKDIVAYGHPEELAERIVKVVEPFLGYGFNRSHAACYAYIAYQTAYFKYYYPVEFMSALLTIFGSDTDRAIKYIAECKRMGINVLPPDVNTSQEGFTIEGSNLRFGLKSIKGLGAAVVDNIMEGRPFESLDDMVTRMPKRQLNKKSIAVLAQCGALDELGQDCKNRMDILQTLYHLRGDKDNISNEVKAFTEKGKLDLEKKFLGLYVSGNPLEKHAESINWDLLGDNEKVNSAGVVTSLKPIKTKRGDMMAFVNVETLEGNKRLVLFPDVYAPIKDDLQKDLTIKFTCYMKYNPQYDERSIIATQVKIPKRINKDILQG